jgi:hypothetical protein
MPKNDRNPSPSQNSDTNWFRPPTRRENRIAAGLFIGFGIFFFILFWIQKNFWFRWVVLALAVGSIWYALRHVLDARQSER